MKVICLVIVSLVLLAFTNNKKSLLTAKYCGTYFYSFPDVDAAFRCAEIYPETDTTVLFYLSLNRGAPTYGMGQLYGRAHLVNGVGTYNSIDSDDCRLKLRFCQDSLIIESIDGKYSCPYFVFHVLADGNYIKLKNKCEDFFIDLGNDTTYFGVDPKTWGLRGVNK